MQPDPTHYLLAARRELQKIVDSGGTNPVDSLTIQRVAELLAQLALRYDELPEILSTLRSRQCALLAETTELMRSLGLEIAADAPLPPYSDIGPRSFLRPDAQIEEFDSFVRAQANCLCAIASRPGEGDENLAQGVGMLFTRACALEAEGREGYRRALEKKKREFDDRAPAAEEATRAPLTEDALRGYLRGRFPILKELDVANLHRHIGINTKDILLFDVLGHPDWPEHVVLRRLRGFNVNSLASMPYEFALLSLLRSKGIPVPKVLLVEAENVLGHPFMIMELVAGNALQARQLGAAGPQIAAQMARHLAAIHCLDPKSTQRPELKWTPRERVARHIDFYYDQWRVHRLEPSSTIETAYAWARSNVQQLSECTVLVHGDYDLRNLLINGDRVSAILDWERSHIGHPAEDLAYCRNDVQKLMPWNEFLGIYHSDGGPPITQSDLQFFEIWCQLFRIASIVGAHHGFSTGKHADFLLGSAAYIEYYANLDVLSDLLSQLDRTPLLG